MLDAVLRRQLRGPLDRIAATLDRPGITPDRLTILGLALGMASAGLAAAALWWPAVVAWWLSRLADGLDGSLARRRIRRVPADSGAGGYLDIVADFTVYGATVVGIGVGAGGSMLPYLAVLFCYYVNGTAFLAFSSVAERTGRKIDDGRSMSFLGGLAEGGETIAVHSLLMLLPGHAGAIATGWAVVVGVSAAQRAWAGYRLLR